MENMNELLDKLSGVKEILTEVMGRLLELGNAFTEKSDWKDLALIKFCLCAIGVLIGLSIPKKTRKFATVIAVFVFLATYIPLMIKVVKIGMALFQEEKMFVEE